MCVPNGPNGPFGPFDVTGLTLRSSDRSLPESLALSHEYAPVRSV